MDVGQGPVSYEPTTGGKGKSEWLPLSILIGRAQACRCCKVSQGGWLQLLRACLPQGNRGIVVAVALHAHLQRYSTAHHL